MLKKLSITALSLLIAPLLPRTALAEAVSQRADRISYLNTGFHFDTTPYSYVDTNQQFVSYSVDTSDRIKASLEKELGEPVERLTQPIDIGTEAGNSNVISGSQTSLNQTFSTELFADQLTSIETSRTGELPDLDSSSNLPEHRPNEFEPFQDQISTASSDLLPDSSLIPIAAPADSVTASVQAQALDQPVDESEATESGATAEVNTGQDPTRPVTRVDLRIKYQDLPDLDLPQFDDSDIHAWTFTLRADKPFSLGNGWALSTRFDLPVIVNNIPSLDNTDGSTDFGLSDSLIQLLAITPPQGRWTFAGGTQVIFPTATEDQFGTGKWQLAPSFAVKYDLPELTPGSFTALLLRDKFSFAGDEDRNDINQLVIQPLFNVNLPNFWFVTFAPEILYDWNTGDWFVPFDISLGKLLNPTTVVSLEMKVPLIDDLEQYNLEIEARLGFFF
jgi:hypothetical protein